MGAKTRIGSWALAALVTASGVAFGAQGPGKIDFHGALRDSVKKNTLSKSKPGKSTTAAGGASQKSFANFAAKITELETKLFALNERALSLTRELRCEFGKKGFTTSV